MIDYKKRKVEGPILDQRGKAKAKDDYPQKEDEEVITVNRWQDLQHQLGGQKMKKIIVFPQY